MGMQEAQRQSLSGKFLGHGGLLLWANSVHGHCSKFLCPQLTVFCGWTQVLTICIHYGTWNNTCIMSFWSFLTSSHYIKKLSYKNSWKLTIHASFLKFQKYDFWVHEVGSLSVLSKNKQIKRVTFRLIFFPGDYKFTDYSQRKVSRLILCM